jgi:hypothetical protein
MSPALIIALILFPMLYAISHSWRQLKRERERGTNLQYKQDPDSVSPLADIGERRQASGINEPRARHRLNDQVARLLAMLAATSFAIAIASRYLSTW